MRKIIFILPLFLATAIVSCGPSQKEKAEQEAKEQAIRDSLVQDSIKQAKELQDSIDWVTFTTNDLNICGLHGHVKSVSETERGLQLKYDEEGKLTQYWICYYGVTDKYKLIRDKKGIISNMVLKNPSADAYKTEIEYTYDADGRLRKYTAEHDRLQREVIVDDEGRIATCDEKYYYSDDREFYKSVYKYTKFDLYGNWIECLVTTQTKIIPYDYETGDFENESNCPWKNEKPYTIKRIIEYYER